MKHSSSFSPASALQRLEEEERQQKRRVRSVWASLGLILLCLLLLVGSTFAWFTDTTQSTGRIQAGNLKISFFAGSGITGGELNDPVDLSDSSKRMFNEDDFMPGASGYRYLKIENNGTMPLSYQVEFAARDEKKLGEVITFTLEKVVENGEPISSRLVSEAGGDAIDQETGVKSANLPVGTCDIYKLTYTMAGTLDNKYNATGSEPALEYLLDATLQANQVNE